MENRIQIDAGACLLGALLLLVLPLDWLLSALGAAAFHECCHGAAILLLGGRIRSLRIGAGGAKMDADIPGIWQELLCAAAGPAGSLLLLAFCHAVPKLAICGLIQGGFNLLPLYPLDGGRILRCCLQLLWPEQAEGLQKGLERLVIGTALAAALVTGWLLSREMLLLAALFLLIRVRARKIPCKRRQIRVQ